MKSKEPPEQSGGFFVLERYNDVGRRILLLRDTSVHGGLMKPSAILLSLVSVALPAMAQPVSNPSPAISAASVTHSVWSINVVGLKGELLGTFTLELSDESTDTCMSGEWKKARLVRSSFPALPNPVDSKSYFPTYESDGQTLTIQLNSPRLCDAYLMLSGKFTDREGKGEYFSESLGGANHLGTFTAERQKP